MKKFKYISNCLLIIITIIIGFNINPVLSGIPEPDIILYGKVSIGETPYSQGEVVIKINNISLAAGKLETLPESCGRFILRVPMGGLEPRLPGTAMTGETAQIYLNDNPVAAATVTIGEKGKIQEINLVLADVNGDGIPDGADNDMDGVSDIIENGAPNNGDGNNDNIRDSEQDNVASLLALNGTDYVTIASADGTVIADCKVIENPSPENTPEGYEFPYGFFEFQIDRLEHGASTQAIIYLPENATPTTYYKFGKTPDNIIDHWYEFYFENEIGAEIEANVITMNFTDGKYGDDDLDAKNGSIKDPGGPAVISVSQTNSGGGGGSSSGCFISGSRE